MLGGKARRSAKPALFPIASIVLNQTGACQPQAGAALAHVSRRPSQHTV
jgi:hypothetical protein